MRVDLFDFELPGALIARRPATPRGSARLLVVGDGLRDRRFSDLPDLLTPGDVLVLNDTRVIPARLAGVREAERGAAKVEVTLLRELVPTEDGGEWAALARPAKRLRAGDTVRFGGAFSATVAARAAGGEVRLSFALPRAGVLAALDDHGRMPIPPYLGRAADARDATDYQTVFARRPGAVAAPTASLHVTGELLSRLRGRGVELARVTLHVGAGTFRPVAVADTDDHEMEAEWGEVPQAAASLIDRRRAEGGRVVALGTTSLRLLESAARADGRIEPGAGDTDLFIAPGYRFRAVDALVTNFHLPRSTLFMLVSAFAGRERMLAAYRHAMGAGYRFYSYGDACLLTRAAGAEGAA